MMIILVIIQNKLMLIKLAFHDMLYFYKYTTELLLNDLNIRRFH